MSDVTPEHPGVQLRHLLTSGSNSTLAGAARLLNVSRQTISNITAGKSSITAEMAVRLEYVFDVDAQRLLERQLDYDLYQARLNAPELSKSPSPVQTSLDFFTQKSRNDLTTGGAN